MIRNLSPLLLLACLGACAGTGRYARRVAESPATEAAMPPAILSSMSSAAFDRKDPGAPDSTSLPVGVGFTAGPTAFMVAGTLDFPIDKKVTFGPSLQYGIDNDTSLIALTGQLKYFLPIIGDGDSFTVLPYATGGIGVVSIDKDGRPSDTGVVIDAGAGVRYLTGEHYRIGSEARLNLIPDSVAGDNFYFSLELIQIVITF